MISAATWSVLGQFSLYGIRFISFFIVPHFLTPTDYGVFGYAVLFVGLFQLIIEAVLPIAVVYSPQPVAEISHISMAGALIVAVIGYAIVCAVAAPAAHLLEDPRATLLFPIMGTQLFMSALYSAQAGILQRELEFRRLFLVRVFGLLPSGIITIILAVAGYRYWALVVGWLCGGVSQLIATWVLVPFPKRPRRYDWNKARELFSFSRWVTLDIVANWGLEYGTGFFIGTALGAASLGRFRLADQIIRAVCAVSLDPLSPVVYSAMSALRREGGDPVAALPKLNHIFGTISIPLCGAFVLIATPLSLLMGVPWKGTAQIFALDSIVWGIDYLVQGVPQLFRAIGRPALVALIRIPLLAVQVVALLLAARGDMVAFLLARIGIEVLMIIFTALVLMRTLQLPIWRLLGGHVRQFVLIPLSVGVTFLATSFLPSDAVLLRLVFPLVMFGGLCIIIASRDPDSYFGYLVGFMRKLAPGRAGD
jgi:O-antigen/teichoic acid export membrane protein